MILYFSGTGNSRYTAELISRMTCDEAVSMNDLIKRKDKSVQSSEKPFVFIAPVYAGRIPRIVDAYIRETEFQGNKNAYFIVTCSRTPWATEHYTEQLCAKKGFTFLGFAAVVMPQNYIMHSDIKAEDENDAIIETAIPKMKQLAELIKESRLLPKENPGKAMMSMILNPIMYALMISAKGFYATDACNGCGECAERCPLNNITMKNGKPHWGKDCTHCMACIGGCSQNAIENGKVTQGRNRYYCTKTPSGK